MFSFQKFDILLTFQNLNMLSNQPCSQRDASPNTDPYSPDTDCVLPYKPIHSRYRENTGSVFGGVSRCVLDLLEENPLGKQIPVQTLQQHSNPGQIYVQSQ